MAWGASTAEVSQEISIAFEASVAARFDNTRIQGQIDMGAARVDAALEYNGYVPATIQALTTTGAYAYCNELILFIAATETIGWLKGIQGDDAVQYLKEQRGEYLARLELLLRKPRQVLAGIAHPSGAPTDKISDTFATGWDYLLPNSTLPTDEEAIPEFSRERPLY